MHCKINRNAFHNGLFHSLTVNSDRFNASGIKRLFDITDTAFDKNYKTRNLDATAG